MTAFFSAITLLTLNSTKSVPNMSTQRFNEYYNELMEKGFIREGVNRKGRKFITLTDKGLRFLQKYRQIIGLVEEFEL